MHDTKPWYLSAGVWGAVAAALASLLGLMKVHLDAAAVADLREWLLSAATLAASGVALYGRVRASRRIATGRGRDEIPGAVPGAAPGAGAHDGAHAGASAVERAALRTQNWRMNKVVLGALLLPACLAHAGGCAVLGQSPSRAYVASDRATYEAIAPEYTQYVSDDRNLDDDRRARRVRTLETWRLRIESAERASGAEGAEGATGANGAEGATGASDVGPRDSNVETDPSRGGRSRTVPVRSGPEVQSSPDDRAAPENSLEDAPYPERARSRTSGADRTGTVRLRPPRD